MIIPIAIAAYLGFGFIRTQRATVDKILHKGVVRPGFQNEPLKFAFIWPIGFFVSGK